MKLLHNIATGLKTVVLSFHTDLSIISEVTAILANADFLYIYFFFPLTREPIMFFFQNLIISREITFENLSE